MASYASSQSNSKKLINYSAIVGDIKHTVSDKGKGRNIQNFYLKKIPTNSLMEKIDKTILISKSNLPLEKITIEKSLEKKGTIHNIDIHKMDSNNNSYNSQMNNSIIYTKNHPVNKETSVSLSKLVSEKMKNKVKMIKNMKYGTEERMRKRLIDNSEAKKIFNQSNMSNMDIKNTSVMFTNTHANNYRLVKNGIFLNKILDSKNLIKNNSNISFENKQSESNLFQNIQTCNCQNNSNLTRALKDLENNLEELLKVNLGGSSSNLISNKDKTKTYYIYKKVFEEMNKLLPEYSKVYNKILNGFNDVISNTLNELKNNKENYEPLLLSKYI